MSVDVLYLRYSFMRFRVRAMPTADVEARAVGGIRVRDRVRVRVGVKVRVRLRIRSGSDSR